MKSTLKIISVLLCTLLACNNPNENKKTNSNESDNRDIPMDNSVDTTGIGNDTLGAGDGKGPDHF